MIWRKSFGFWPVLLYALLFLRLTHRTDLTVIQAAAIAGAAALILLYGLQVWIAGKGFRYLDFRYWSPVLRQNFMKTAGVLCLITALCMLAACFK